MEKLERSELICLSDQTKCIIIPSFGNCARFYSLLNIHKPTLAFHPIVSNVNTASYELVHFLSQCLTHLTCNNLYNMKNSYDFEEKLKLISPSNYTMLSLDVIPLFTNVSIQETLDRLENRLHEFHYSSIKIKEILFLVHLCATKTVLVFNGAFYSQIEVHFLLCFSIFICTILKNNSSVYTSFLIGLDMWMILLFLFLLMLIFPVCCL